MRIFLLISSDPAWALGLARTYAIAGDAVTAVLLDRAAASARPGHRAASDLASALASGVAVAAHDDALRRRALDRSRIIDGVKIIDLDEVADLVGEGCDRAVWL
jgi:intracellular sulfur oxidation DsrE/DsrF family protein